MADEKFLEVDGNRIRYLQTGDGSATETLVLIHGLGASAERWNPVVPLLGGGYRVLAPDLPGFGYSDKPVTDYTPDFFSAFLDGFLRASGAGHPRHIIGSSLGGQVAAEYAHAHPEGLERLVLVSPAGAMKQSTPALDAYIMAAMYPNEQNATAAFEMMEGRQDPAGGGRGDARDTKEEGGGGPVDAAFIGGFIQRMRRPNAKLAFLSALLGMKNSELITPRLQTISVPTMVVWGADDAVIPIRFANSFVSAIRDCRFLRMDGCGHVPYAQDPNAFAEAVLRFLRGGASRGDSRGNAPQE